jgi:hypothetical protein
MLLLAKLLKPPKALENHGRQGSSMAVCAITSDKKVHLKINLQRAKATHYPIGFGKPSASNGQIRPVKLPVQAANIPP